MIKKLEDKKQLIQNFNLCLSIYNPNNIVVYINESQQLNKAKKISMIRSIQTIEYKK